MQGRLDQTIHEDMTLSGSGLNTSSYSHLNHGPGVSNAHMNTGNLNNNNMSGGGDGIGNNNNNNPHANNPGNDFGRNTKSLSGIPGLSGFNLNMHLNSLNKNNNGNNNNNNNHGNHNTNINNAGGNQNMPNNSFVNNNNSDIVSSSLETPSSLNFSSGQNNNSNDNNKTLLKSYNSSSLQLHNPHAMQSHNSEGSLQHFNSGTLQHFGSNMSGLYSKMPLLSSFNIRKNDDYLMSPWSSLGSRGAPANQPQGGGPQHQQQQQQQQQQQRRGFSGMDVDDGGNGQNNNFTFQHSGLSNPQMFRSTSDPKALINALHSGMSEMSESSVELLRNIIHNQDSTGIDRRGVHTPLTAALAARSLSGGLGSGFSSAMAVEHKKRRLECVSPIAERPPQRVQVQPSNFAEVLSKPVLETSMDEIVEAMSLINTGCFVPEDHKLKQLELVVKDRERRADRFHKKKTSADFFTKKIRSLKKKAYSTASSTASNLAGNQKTNSSGQGCTIVVFHRKCQKHSRSCNMDAQSHGPTDIVLSSEPVTRSSYGKWMNAYMKHEKIDG